MSKRLSKKMKKVSKRMSSAAKNCRTRRKSRKSRVTAGPALAGLPAPTFGVTP
jgi:hypothetical protein